MLPPSHWLANLLSKMAWSKIGEEQLFALPLAVLGMAETEQSHNVFCSAVSNGFFCRRRIEIVRVGNHEAGYDFTVRCTGVAGVRHHQPGGEGQRVGAAPGEGENAAVTARFWARVVEGGNSEEEGRGRGKLLPMMAGRGCWPVAPAARERGGQGQHQPWVEFSLSTPSWAWFSLELLNLRRVLNCKIRDRLRRIEPTLTKSLSNPGEEIQAFYSRIQLQTIFFRNLYNRRRYNIPLSGCLLSVQRLGLYWPEPERRRPTRREGQSAMTSGKGLGKQNFESRGGEVVRLGRAD